jgi:Na+-transporting methylmalonyl-CoA/oxaloacetate decarboxylase gamma subunit
MFSSWSILTLVHLIGLSLGVGAATVKLTLLMKAISDPEFIATYLKVMRPITRIIITGLILLTLSGIVWIFMGVTFTTLFIFKLILVLAVWVMGPIIDNVVEPKYKKLAPAPGNQASPEFIRIQRRLLTLETIATLDFYVIMMLGVLLL